MIAVGKLIQLNIIDFGIDDLVDLDGNIIPEDQYMDEFLYWVDTKEEI